MENFKRKFNSLEKAEEFLKIISDHIMDNDLLREFTVACAGVQAAMAYWLIKETQFTTLQREKYRGGIFREEYSQMEMAVAWDEYTCASAEFQMAKSEMQEVLKRLFVT